MRITGIEAVPIRMKQKRVFKTHRESTPHRDYVIVKVKTDEGLLGVAEASTMATWSEPQAASVYALENIIAPAIEGENPFDVQKILHKMDQSLEGFYYSKGAVDIALYDIMGKALGVPAYSCLGGRFRDGIAPYYCSVGIADIEVMVEWAEMLRDLGAQFIKVKVGEDVEHDVEAVRRIRKAVGESVGLKVDANQGYMSSKRAVDAIQRMVDAAGICFAEQPVRKHDLIGMASVTASTSIPIIADESLQQLPDVLRIYENRAANVLCVYLLSSGGITRARQIVEMAGNLGLPCVMGGMNELGLGTAAMLQFAAALPNLLFPGGDLQVPGWFYEDDILTEGFDVERGWVRIPDGPGLGVEVDFDKVERYRVKER